MLGDHSCDGFFPGHFRSDIEPPVLCSRDGRRARHTLFVEYVGDDNCGTFLGEQSRFFRTLSTGTAGDEGYLAFESAHAALLL